MPHYLNYHVQAYLYVPPAGAIERLGLNAGFLNENELGLKHHLRNEYIKAPLRE